MIRLYLLAFLFLAGTKSSFSKSPAAGIPVKWYILTGKGDPASFRVIIDASKVSRFIQLGELRFIADFKDMRGNLISRDTIWLFPKTAPVRYISGAKTVELSFKHLYGPDIKITGIKLFYVWDDTSMSTEPDPFGDKLVIEKEIFGRDSADVSQPNLSNL